MAIPACKVPSLNPMDTLDRTETTTYQPILRTSEAPRAADFERCECTCPELCQVDHDN
jgi:hypothetical protein